MTPADRHPVRRQLGGAVVWAGLGLVVVMLFVLLTRLTDGSEAIRGCTEPGGKCYERSQKQTAEVVGQIGAGNILAVVCALDVPDGTPTDVALEQVTRCVTRRLSKPGGGP